MEIKAETMMEAWRAAIKLIKTNGRTFIDDNGRECHEVNNLVVTVERSGSAPAGVRAMRACRQWRYPSEEELTNIMLNKEAASIYDYLYGQRIFAYNSRINQIDDYVIPLLRKQQQTRRAIVNLLNPERDLNADTNSILGISMIRFQIIDGKLTVTTIIRTSGFFTGWPANIYQIAKLQEYVAHALQLPPGPLTTISLSAHIHTESFDDIETVLGKEALKETETG